MTRIIVSRAAMDVSFCLLTAATGWTIDQTSFGTMIAYLLSC